MPSHGHGGRVRAADCGRETHEGRAIGRTKSVLGNDRGEDSLEGARELLLRDVLDDEHVPVREGYFDLPLRRPVTQGAGGEPGRLGRVVARGRKDIGRPRRLLGGKTHEFAACKVCAHGANPLLRLHLRVDQEWHPLAVAQNHGVLRAPAIVRQALAAKVAQLQLVRGEGSTWFVCRHLDEVGAKNELPFAHKRFALSRLKRPQMVHDEGPHDNIPEEAFHLLRSGL
mmetsp:Transcript_26027/g.76289  ORF Transcript_26027/g.76289 Transcript_26027/m.76289 type:complete len:227 (-) Transcript_26027:3561-4241(-)